MEWKTIETAPETDSLLLWGRSDNSIDGAKIGDLKGWDEPAIHICEFSRVGDDGVRVFYSTELDGWGDGKMQLWATHWMPLPPPPSSG